MNTKDAAQMIAKRLFTNGMGVHVRRLALTNDDGRNHSGWSEAAVADQIEKALRIGVKPSIPTIFRQLTKHDAGCRMGETPWVMVYPVQIDHHRDSLGRSRSNVFGNGWIHLRCNDPDCGGTAVATLGFLWHLPAGKKKRK